MSDRYTGWVVAHPDTGTPVNPFNVVPKERGPNNTFNADTFGGTRTAVAEPPAAVAPAPVPATAQRGRPKKATPANASATELDMSDEAAVLDAIARLGAVETQDAAYGLALDEIAAAERSFQRPAVLTALAGVGR